MSTAERCLFLIGKINTAICNKLIEDLLALANRNSDPIMLFINSPGGDYEPAYDLITTLNRLGVPIITVGHVFVGSAATMVMAAGDIRFCTQGTELMHHAIQTELKITGLTGTVNDVRALAKSLTKKAKSMGKVSKQAMILSTHGSKMTPRQLEKMIHESTTGELHFSDREMKKYGFIQDILPDLQYLSAYIAKHLKKIKKSPET